MKILLSPAKRIRREDDHGFSMTAPRFEDHSRPLLESLESLSYPELKALYKVSDKVARPMYDHLQALAAGKETERYPAILAFDGIAYRYMAPGVFTDRMMAYATDHLYMLSGLYGVLSPLDGITPYRLEMGTKGPFDLYSWWKEDLESLIGSEEEVINLASAEYAKAVKQFRKVTDVKFLRRHRGKLQETAVYAKMARGAMVRWMAEHDVRTADDLKGFDELGYRFCEDMSRPDCLVFVNEAKEHDS